jgi:hypothetical protein
MQALPDIPTASVGLGSCPVCEQAGGELIWDGRELGGSRRWVRCQGCRTARDIEPAPASRPQGGPLDLHAAILAADELISRLREVGYGESWLSRSAARPMLLEYGSGSGSMLSAADWRGFEPVGVEPDPERAALARSRLGVLVFEQLAAVPFMPTDVVVVDRFSRYDNPVVLLASLVSRLVVGGLVVITLPLLDHPLHLASGQMNPLWCTDEHALLFERSGLSLLLLRAGLSPERTWHHPSRPGEAVIIARRN